MKEIYIERSRHINNVKKLNQEPLQVDLIDFKRTSHHGYVINDSSEYQDQNSAIRAILMIIASLLIAGLVYFLWLNSPLIVEVLR